MINAVIFDMDGLMFDSERVAKICWEAAGRQLGYTVTDELFFSVVGVNEQNSQKIITDYFDDSFDYKKFRQTIGKIKREYTKQNGIPLKKGLKELLKYLKNNNIKTAVATSTNKTDAEWLINSAGILGSFDCIICGDMVSKSKPEPDIFLKAIELLGAVPGESMVLEDSFNGIKAAHASGAYAVMVPDLIQPDKYILSLTYKKCESLLEVIDIIEKLNN